jgi:hypothetical protein
MERSDPSAGTQIPKGGAVSDSQGNPEPPRVHVMSTSTMHSEGTRGASVGTSAPARVGPGVGTRLFSSAVVNCR